MSNTDTFYGMAESEILDAIEDGRSIASIAAESGRGRSTLSQWLRANPERSARAHEARERAAEACDEAAEAEIRGAADPFELAKARELAHHLRWKASKIAPTRYGDKMTLAGDPDAPLSQAVDPNVLAAMAKMTPEQLRALATKQIKGE